MRRDYYKSPWFLTLVAFAIFGAGYIVGDDNRIEKQNQEQLVQVSQIVKAHYAKECGK